MAATPQTIPSYAEKLPYLDSIHDFWKERSPPPADGRLKAKPDQEDAEFNIPQPKKVLGILRGHLLRTLGNHITTPPIDWPAAPHPATPSAGRRCSQTKNSHKNKERPCRATAGRAATPSATTSTTRAGNTIEARPRARPLLKY